MNRATIKILVVDDELFMRKILVHLLTGLGFEAITACADGAHGLRALAADPPDLILLDLNMPAMDGAEFIRKLSEHRYRGSLLLVSGEDERMLKMAVKLVRAHQLTVLGHLRKPVSPLQLAEIIGDWTPAAPAVPTVGRTYSANELRTAIAQGELVIHYQPKVAIATGAVVGVEALVRWWHPTDGLVYPDRFIALAEAHGLIDDLTRAVLTEAVAQTRAWQRAGLPLRVAINLSMENLSSSEFTEFVAGIASAAAVAPEDIVLEVTESRLMRNQRRTLETLARLRLKRFRLSIDDFGTGHSSLAQLRDIPFDELKIDRSFVHDAWRDQTARAMYDASLGLGKQLGMEVVAEGVEDSKDWDLVQRTHCDLAQGNYIARPMPAAALAGWLATRDVTTRPNRLGTP